LKRLRQTKDALPQYNIGEYTYGVPLVVSSRGLGATLVVGKFCSFAEEVTMLLSVEHRTDWVTTYPFNQFFWETRHILGHPSSKGDIIIGNDVWVGYRTTILSGVRIDSGAVIGASSVVASDVGAYEVWAGNPARKIRDRFSDHDKLALLKIAWWNWPIEKILDHAELLCSNQLEELWKV